MKNMVKRTVLLVAVSLLSIAAVQAAEKPFKFSIGTNQTLIINAPDGTQLAALPTATVGKTIDSGNYSFQVSYGQDSNGNLSLIVTSNPDHPTDVAFTLDGRNVAMDQTSAVTLTLTNDGRDVVVDPGYTGSVKVNGQSVTTPVVASNSTTGTSTVTPITSTTSGNGGTTGTTSTTTTTTTSTTTTADNTSTTTAQQTQQQQQQQQPTGTGAGGLQGIGNAGGGLTMDDPLSGNNNIASSDVRTNPSAVVNPVTEADPTTPN